MSDNSSKEVEIKNGLTLKKIFLGELLLYFPAIDFIDLGNSDWKILFLKYVVESKTNNTGSIESDYFIKNDTNIYPFYYYNNMNKYEMIINNNKLSVNKIRGLLNITLLEVYVLE